MIYKKNHKQTELFDAWRHLGPKRRKFLDESWAGVFRKHVLEKLPVNEFAVHYCDGIGRPSKELYTCLGVILLQNQLDLTNEETRSQLSFDTRWHYALNLPEESDNLKYMCEKTLYNIQTAVFGSRLYETVFDLVRDELGRAFDVDYSKQRIDSVHIKSNMARMGRLRIITKTINKFLVNLKRHYKQEFKQLPSDITDKYFSKKAMQCFGMVKPSESKQTLKSAADHLFDLSQYFKEHPKITNMDSYKLLCRVLKEQCNISGDDKKASLKLPEDVPSDSVQNPSDPDAGYIGHKGQGYSAQLMETYCEDPNKEIRKQKLNLITYVEVEPACNPDDNALLPALETAQKNGVGPKQVIADTPYGGDDNCQKAKTMHVEVISPVKNGRKNKGYHLDDFNLSEHGKVINCPEGNKPVSNKKNKRYSAAFDINVCSACLEIRACSVKKGKKYYYLRYTDKDLRIAKRRIYQKTDEFKNRYRFRAGNEATNSECDRRTGIKRLRVRRLKRVRLCVFLKTAGLNILRAAAAQKAQMDAKREGKAALRLCLQPVFDLISIFKELFGLIRGEFKKFPVQFAY